jgi:tRNA(Ile)-lysidine synthase
MPPSQKGLKHKFIRTVVKTIEDYHMLQSRDRVLVGVSGGPDSVTLLHVLNHLAPRYDLTLGVAHLNHGLRLKESDLEAEFVQKFAAHLKLPCFIDKTEVQRHQRLKKLSLEEAARELRYRFYQRIAKTNRFNKIALGHQQNDNAELVLMVLLRGTGPLGLGGIPPVRDGQFIRPLIRIGRSDIMAYLTEQGLDYVSDSSNQDMRFLRNRIRHQLIPLLESSYTKAATGTLARMAEILHSEEQWLECVLEPAFSKAVTITVDARVIISIPALLENHPAAIRRILRKALAGLKGNLRRITFKHIDAAVRLVQLGPADGSLNLPSGIIVKRRNDQLLFLENKKTARLSRKRGEATGQREAPDYEYIIERPDPVLLRETGQYLKFYEIDPKAASDFHPAGQITAFFDMEALCFPLILRNFRPGDRFSPLGLGGSQKLKKFFINNKVPRAERSKCPLLLSREKIIWVVGYRIDDSVKVRPSTQKVLKVELSLA